MLTTENQESLLLTHPPSGQRISRGHEPILSQNPQDLARGGKGYMVGRVAKRTIGIQEDGQNTYRRDIVLISIWEQIHYPS